MPEPIVLRRAPRGAGVPWALWLSRDALLAAHRARRVLPGQGRARPSAPRGQGRKRGAPLAGRGPPRTLAGRAAGEGERAQQ